MGGIDADAEERKAFVFDPFREEDEQAAGLAGQQKPELASSSSCVTSAATSTSSMLPGTTPTPTANLPTSSAREVRSSTTSSSKSSSGFSLLDFTAALPPRNIVLSSGVIRSGAPSATSDSSPTSSLFPDLASGGGSAFSTFGSGSSTGSYAVLQPPPSSTISSNASNASTALLPNIPQTSSIAMQSLGSRASQASLHSKSSRTVPLAAVPGYLYSGSHSSSNVALGAEGGSLSKQPSTISFNTSLSRSPTPVAGYRIPATGSNTLSSFPLLEMCGPAFKDKDGKPIYVVSAILGNAVHPAKAGPHLTPPVRMSFGGVEKSHDGRYDLLPITSEMKWVKASHGRVPDGYAPVQGGYEDTGQQLYHALAKIEGHWVPGKTGLHLLGGNFPYHHREVRMIEGYRVLCWAKQ